MSEWRGGVPLYFDRLLLARQRPEGEGEKNWGEERAGVIRDERTNDERY